MRGRGIITRVLAAVIAVAATFAIAGPVGTASAAPVFYGFDGGSAQGWQVSNDNEGGPFAPSLANPGDGNPGGALFYQDPFDEVGADAAYFLWKAPSIAPGALAGNYGGTVSFDFRVDMATASTVGFVILNGTQGGLNLVIEPVQTTAFQRYSSPLVAGAGWFYCPPGPPGCVTGASESQIRSALAGTNEILLDMDVRPGMGEVYRLDNFSVSDPPPAVQAGVSLTPTPTPVTRKRCKKKGKKSAEASKKKRKKCKRKKKRK